MKTRARIQLSRPYFQPEWYSLVPEYELQEVYNVLLHIKLNDSMGPADKALAAAVFLSLSEALLEKYSPPFKGGKEWDSRKQPKEEWR